MNNMKLTLLIVVIGLSSSYAYLAEKDYGDKLLALTKVWHNKCVVITGVTQAQIDELKNGQFGDNENAKRYILCLWMFSDVLRPDFTINIPLLKEVMPKKLVGLTQKYLECLNDTTSAGTEPYEKTFGIAKCIYNANPEDFLMF
ncbi:uncharacterized protein [Leptinotarsa decemlineata]|uniref:uncharacterized protein n=1 Tax=Leptinotarsa decemlineata TaxID=7539 RepID=UPI003D30A5F0